MLYTYIYIGLFIGTSFVVSIVFKDESRNDFISSIGLGSIWFLIIPFYVFILISSFFQNISLRVINKLQEKKIAKSLQEKKISDLKTKDNITTSSVGM